MKVITETERLIIRELLPTDSKDMLELHSDPEVHIYLANKTITSKQKIIECIDVVKQQYVDYGVGRWAMINKSTGEFIGWTGLEFVFHEINGHRHFYDLGYRLMKRYWGQGFATESAIASLDYGFEKLNIDTVYAMVDCDNMGSNKILNKVGLNFIDQFNLDGVQHNWYKISKMEYLNSKVDGLVLI